MTLTFSLGPWKAYGPEARKTLLTASWHLVSSTMVPGDTDRTFTLEGLEQVEGELMGTFHFPWPVSPLPPPREALADTLPLLAATLAWMEPQVAPPPADDPVRFLQSCPEGLLVADAVLARALSLGKSEATVIPDHPRGLPHPWTLRCFLAAYLYEYLWGSDPYLLPPGPTPLRRPDLVAAGLWVEPEVPRALEGREPLDFIRISLGTGVGKLRKQEVPPWPSARSLEAENLRFLQEGTESTSPDNRRHRARVSGLERRRWFRHRRSRLGLSALILALAVWLGASLSTDLWTPSPARGLAGIELIRETYTRINRRDWGFVRRVLKDGGGTERGSLLRADLQEALVVSRVRESTERDFRFVDPASEAFTDAEASNHMVFGARILGIEPTEDLGVWEVHYRWYNSLRVGDGLGPGEERRDRVTVGGDPEAPWIRIEALSVP